MPVLADHYRQKAEEARQHANRALDPYLRSMWRDIADNYDHLAGIAERGSKLLPILPDGGWVPVILA